MAVPRAARAGCPPRRPVAVPRAARAGGPRARRHVSLRVTLITIFIRQAGLVIGYAQTTLDFAHFYHNNGRRLPMDAQRLPMAA